MLETLKEVAVRQQEDSETSEIPGMAFLAMGFRPSGVSKDTRCFSKSRNTRTTEKATTSVRKHRKSTGADYA